MLVGLGLSAQAEQTFHKSITPPISKYEAMRIALDSPNTVLYKCSQVAITEKATFKNIPASGKNDFVDKSVTK